MKISKYVNIIEYKDVIIAHNSLTNVGIRTIGKSAENLKKILTSGDLTGFEESTILRDMERYGFIVDDSADEVATANYVIDNAVRPLHLIMIVTRQCNFACPYCYEKHENKVMGKEVYSASLRLIKDFIKRTPKRNIYISFFGGEPLLELDNIVSFMDAVQQEFQEEIAKGVIKVRAHATTNGYLLTPQNFIKLNSAGIKDFQITIDGDREAHNKTRMLRNGNGTWEQIMSNLLAAKSTNLDFDIQLRTNYSEQSLSGINDYFQYLEDHFGGDKRFNVYFEAVKDLGDSSNKSNEFLKNNLIRDNPDIVMQLFHLMSEHNIYQKGFSSLIEPCGMRCYAANSDSFAIDYNGNILKCTVKIDNSENVVGNVLDEHRIIPEKIAKWTSYLPNQKCLDCSLYPICCGKKCPINYSSNEQCELVRGIYESTLKHLYINRS